MIHKIYDKDAEMALLGTIIHSPDCLISVSDIISPDDFYNTTHKKIYDVCWELYKKDSKLIDIININNIAGGNLSPLLIEIDNHADLSHNAVSLAEIIKHKSIHRNLYNYTLKLQDKFKSDNNINEIISAAEKELLGIIIQTKDKKSGNVKSVIDRLVGTLENIQARENKNIGLHTGFGCLNSCIEGYIPGHLWIIGAWTSTGKTTLMWQLINNIYKQNISNPHIMVISTEMTDEGNLLKLISNETGISSLSILKGYASDKVALAMSKIHNYNIHIIDNLYKWDSIYLTAKKQNVISGLDVLFIDFIQNIQDSGTIYERMSTLAPKMQELAKELKCTVVAMSQLSNEDAGKGDKLKFKGAGELSAACDLGIILERETGEDGLPNENINMLVKKNRWGMTGKKKLVFTNNYTAIEEI